MPPQSPHRAIAPGDLVGLNEEGRSLLAVVQALKGTRADLRVGHEAKAQQRAVRQLDLVAAGEPSDPPAARLSQPPWQLSADRLQRALPSSRELAAAWLLLAQDPMALDLAAFTDLVADGGDPAQRAACWLWLQGPQVLFRWRQQQVEARPLVDVRRLRREARRLQLIEQRRRQWHDALRRRQPIAAERLQADQQAQLALLREWAAGDTAVPLPEELRRALQAAHCHAEAASIRHLLVDLGQWQKHHLPSLENTTWQAGFAAALDAEAQRLATLADEPQPGDEHRTDRTGLHTVTIDDEDTGDIDDGLSLEERPGQPARLWIHIADPGRLVAAGSPLDLEARRRASSLYLARGPLPMFPECLSTGAFSLRMGRRCPAWSLWVELAGDGAVGAYGIERTWVKPAYRLSYQDADELLELAPPREAYLGTIEALMQQRRRWRLSRGALALEQAEGRVRCRGEAAELEITEPTPARSMVAEAMILAGSVVAQHGQSHGLALPYRSQLPAELPPAEELERLPPGPVRHAALKRCLSRGHLGATPAPHFSLGLASYVQATSPIRRYGDLVVQRQLLAHAQGEPGLGEAELAALLADLEGPIRQGILIAREDQRHWQQVWFEQQRQVQWQAEFLRWLRPQDRLGLVHVGELAMDLAAECHGDLAPGDALLLRVQQVDSLRDLLRLAASV